MRPACNEPCLGKAFDITLEPRGEPEAFRERDPLQPGRSRPPSAEREVASRQLVFAIDLIFYKL